MVAQRHFRNMQFHQRPDLNGAGNSFDLHAQKKSPAPVQLILPNEQVLLGFPPDNTSLSTPPPNNSTSAVKAVFMTNPMRKHPQVIEFQVAFSVVAAVNLMFTLSFLSPSENTRAWFNTSPYSLTEPRTSIDEAMPMLMIASICMSLVAGVVSVWRKAPLPLRLFVLCTTTTHPTKCYVHHMYDEY
ncbi:hypothetical protein, variant [Aphanomyces astaci]|uniref:Uncharacterized protein n=1 Tax=Aphanomyces astaci TaxID=112090 RepID=W4GWR9_APHAT|nr:hypothetical protein, variant [Aphanomyces astaci]ETV83363.1 hypothetical protein, variant [Aphanomyces astaci]|eukprot:XP_009826793.1 hypothetical protein, variant [Aphanomyces astaci]